MSDNDPPLSTDPPSEPGTKQEAGRQARSIQAQQASTVDRGEWGASPLDDEEEGNDAPMRAAIWTVAGTGAVLAAGAGVGFGVRAAIGVAIGGAIATANLLVFARIGQAFLSRKGNTAPWAIIAVIKLVALLGGVWLILKSGYVSGLALTIGYGSLPIGITLGSLFGPKPPEPKAESSSRRRRVNQRRADVVQANRADADAEGEVGASTDEGKPSKSSP